MDDSTTKGCTHRWVLGEPGLMGISGTCRNCGMSRIYPAALGTLEPTPDYAELDRNRIVRSLEVATSGERATA